MRRFPAPPTHGGPSTPSSSRSAEAPMQYEWEKPRQFPASPFVAPGAATGDEGQPARKRTHYEAMDVDTPPRAPLAFPPSATAPASETFRFSPPAPSMLDAQPHEPAFDADKFKPEEAFGLQDEQAAGDVSMTAADPDESVQEGTEEDLVVAVREGPRRRKPSGRSSRRRSSRASEDDDDSGASDDERADADGGFLGVLKNTVGRRKGDSQFSFQVHHHHAPAAGLGAGAMGAPEEQRPERWMRKSTPYVLLGYLQFGSLTLLALLVLSLFALFLFTLYTDIQARLAELTLELRSEIVQCAKKFMDNGCAAPNRFPALERSCVEWEECMHREVVVHGKTRVVAETIAEVVNGFVDVISFKTMLFVLLTLGITIYGSSTALSVLASRARAAPPASPSAPAHFNGYAPPPGAAGYAPYGLPYGGQPAPWVVESAGCERERAQAQLGLGAGPGGGAGARRRAS
ncbi:hypothetical protein JCM10450v2_003938 [Rhodotorula kratochvilovae]